MCETEKGCYSGMDIKPEYMMLNIKASTDVEAIKILAENFYKAGAVKETFVPAILQREKDFCTGLPPPPPGSGNRKTRKASNV